MTLNRVVSSLPPDLDDLCGATIGALIEVHRQLGAGMSEAVYALATCVELTDRRISFEAERLCPVRYRGRFLCNQRVDLLVDGRLVLEIKSVAQLNAVHVAQVVSYLRLTGARAGLLVNFNVPVLKQGIRRVVL